MTPLLQSSTCRAHVGSTPPCLACQASAPPPIPSQKGTLAAAEHCYLEVLPTTAAWKCCPPLLHTSAELPLRICAFMHGVRLQAELHVPLLRCSTLVPTAVCIHGCICRSLADTTVIPATQCCELTAAVNWMSAGCIGSVFRQRGFMTEACTLASDCTGLQLPANLDSQKC